MAKKWSWFPLNNSTVNRYLHNIEIALEALLANKLKSALTALGILFGVAAVISMIAIGRGAKQEIMNQMELIGASNIIVEAYVPERSGNEGQDSNESQQGQDKKEEEIRFSPGLDMQDLRSLRTIVPNLEYTSPEVILNSNIIYRDRSMSGNCIGISNDYFNIYHFALAGGRYFSDLQQRQGKRVCIIGSNVNSRLFSQKDAIGAHLKFGGVWLKVVGVLEKEPVTSETISEYGFNNVNASIYIPDRTFILRIKNRKILHHKPRASRSGQPAGVPLRIHERGNEKNNYHQLDRIIMKVKNSDQLAQTAQLTERILTRRHNGMKDFQVIVPEMLLQQKQETKEMFNFVLGAIAGISLLVGGIGIMNIMFATVMERIREIGIRLAMGAKKKDILVQFMSEALMISLAGGLLGIGVGWGMSGLIEKIAGIQVQVTLGSILVAFLVSATVGVVFGYSPAKRAAEKDPIESLRYE